MFSWAVKEIFSLFPFTFYETNEQNPYTTQHNKIIISSKSKWVNSKGAVPRIGKRDWEEDDTIERLMRGFSDGGEAGSSSSWWRSSVTEEKSVLWTMEKSTIFIFIFIFYKEKHFCNFICFNNNYPYISSLLLARKKNH